MSEMLSEDLAEAHSRSRDSHNTAKSPLRYRQQGFWARRRLRLMMLGMIALPVLSWWFGDPGLRRVLFWPGALLTLCGLALRWWAAGWLRKHEALATSGPYAIVRHPLYLGSGLIALGHGTMSGIPFAWSILPLFWLLLHWPALREEEQFLLEKYGASYAEFQSRVGGLLPRPPRPGAKNSNSARNTESPAEGFSWRQAWRNREYEALSVNAVAIAYYAYLFARASF